MELKIKVNRIEKGWSANCYQESISATGTTMEEAISKLWKYYNAIPVCYRNIKNAESVLIEWNPEKVTVQPHPFDEIAI